MTRLIPTILALLLVLAAVPAPAIADEDDGLGVFDDGDDDLTLAERVGAANDALAGVAARVWWDAKSLFSSDADDATAVEQQADDVQELVNEHNESLETYINDRFDGDASDWNVIAVRFEQGEHGETRYLVADVNETDQTFENGSMVESTDRDVDATVVLEDYAAANAADELDSFIENYVEEDRDVDAALRRRLAQQYLGDVELPDEVTD